MHNAGLCGIAIGEVIFLNTNEKLVVLDFGGQFNQLITRRIRDLGVYCEIVPYDAAFESYSDGLIGLILTGGPASVNQDGAPKLEAGSLLRGVPVLGICYGMQLIASVFGGAVGKGEAEFGKAELTAQNHPLFKGFSSPSDVWMSHNDGVLSLPEGFSALASTSACPLAAFADEARRIYGVQFHPEASHSAQGSLLLSNFIYGICGAKGGWKMENLAGQMIDEIRAQVGGGTLVAGLSGGVDSSVAAVLAHKAIGDRLTCIFVDHGLMRLNEPQEVMEFYGNTLGLKIIHVDASERFLGALKGVADPEQKRKIIGREFVRVFEEEAAKTGAECLLQGTIYPDIIESGVGNAAVIKSHHNVGGLPEDSKFRELVEPLKMLFKDEVRALGEAIGIPSKLVWRQPFPGPGLGIRVIGELTIEKLDKLRLCDAILREEIALAGLDREVWQYFAVLPGIRTVGVKGDARTYVDVVAIRAITSVDAMSGEPAELPYSLLKKISNRMTNEVEGVSRVVYDISSKPPATIEWE